MSKKLARIRRGMKTRCSFRKLGLTRMIIHRTSKHIYAQIVSSDNSEVLVSASTLERIIRDKLRKEKKVTGNKYAAALVGQIIAERALKRGLSSLSFDRSGFKYHGRIQSLAESSRKFGIKF